MKGKDGGTGDHLGFQNSRRFLIFQQDKFRRNRDSLLKLLLKLLMFGSITDEYRNNDQDQVDRSDCSYESSVLDLSF